MKRQTFTVFLTFNLSLGLAAQLVAAERVSSRSNVAEDFYIVSSIDLKKKELLLKRPTEVTELVGVNEKTAFRDEQGKPLGLADLRAGDTVYVSSYLDPGGARIALRLRKGAMTLPELRRRYLTSAR
jgi:hypothetical protein